MLSQKTLIRHACESDLPSLASLEEVFPTDRLSGRSYRRLLRQGHADVLVHDAGAAVVGIIAGAIVVLYRRGSTVARIYSLAVDPTYRRAGIASKLIDEAERAGAARNCTVIRLEVRPDNAAALALYERRGYTVTGRKEGYYEDGTVALTMQKRLAEHA